MDWAVSFFKMQANLWRRHRSADEDEIESSTSSISADSQEAASVSGRQLGHQCYSLRQETMWLIFSDLATHRFSRVKMDNREMV